MKTRVQTCSQKMFSSPKKIGVQTGGRGSKYRVQRELGFAKANKINPSLAFYIKNFQICNISVSEDLFCKKNVKVVKDFQKIEINNIFLITVLFRTRIPVSNAVTAMEVSEVIFYISVRIISKIPTKKKLSISPITTFWKK